MADTWRVTRIGGTSLPVIPSVLVAGLAGLAFGTWFGLAGPGASDPGAAMASASPSTSTFAASMTPSAGAASPSSAPSVVVASAGPSGSGVVVEATGDRDGTTPEITVTPGWQLDWQAEGTRLAIRLVGAAAPDDAVVLDESGPAVGVTAPSWSGTFALEVSSDGPWRITVVQP